MEKGKKKLNLTSWQSIAQWSLKLSEKHCLKRRWEERLVSLWGIPFSGFAGGISSETSAFLISSVALRFSLFFSELSLSCPLDCACSHCSSQDIQNSVVPSPPRGLGWSAAVTAVTEKGRSAVVRTVHSDQSDPSEVKEAEGVVHFTLPDVSYPSLSGGCRWVEGITFRGFRSAELI